MNISPFHRFYRLFSWILFVFLLKAGSITAQTDPQCFQLFYPVVSAAPGDTVCLPVMVRGFNQIVGAQFVVYWNPDQLEYVGKELGNSALPNIKDNNFGPPIPGRIPFAWNSQTGFPISRPDSSQLFSLCFRVNQNAAGFLPLHIGGSDITLFEVSQQIPGEPIHFLPLAQQIGGVLTDTVGVSDLSITSSCVVHASCNQASGSTSVEVEGGQAPYQYVWSGPNGFSATTASISGLSGGLYKLTVTDQAGHVIQFEIELRSSMFNTTVLPQAQPAFCGQANGCALVDVGGSHPPFTFEWSAGGSTSSENCNLPPGQHSVSVTDAIGCQSVYQIEVENNTSFEIASNWLVIPTCNGTQSADATPLNVTGNFSYQWSNGATTAVADGLIEGYYRVTVTALSGNCSSTGEFLVLNNVTQNWGLELDAICQDPGNSLSGSLVLRMNPDADMTFPLMVAWSNGSTRLLDAPLDSGVLDSLLDVGSGHYTVTVTAGGDCTKTLEKTLDCSIPPPVQPGFPWFYVRGNGLQPDSCAGVYAKNFDDLTALHFSLSWTDYGSELREIRNLALPGLTLSDFSLASDRLGVQWQSANPISLPEESLLFEVCILPATTGVAEGLRFGADPVSPVVTAQGMSLSFLGRNDAVYYQDFVQADPVFCAAQIVAPDCMADGKAQILIEPCYPAEDLSGSFVYQDASGLYHSFYDLSGLRFSEPGSYTIYGNRAEEAYEQLYAYVPGVSMESACVWPGDADNNNAVNHHDLLYLGLAFGAQGNLRNDASTAWTGQDAADWSQATALRQVNYKNIDTNGDGTINAADTLAIVANWGRVINPATDNPFDAPLDSLGHGFFPNLTIATDTLMPGEAVNFPLLLGSQDHQLDQIYGIAFSISYDPKVVKDQIRFTPADSWFGEESQFLWIQKNFPRQGRLDVAITRTDGLPVSGWGAIGNVFIIIEDNIFGNQDLHHDSTAYSQFFFSEISSTGAGEISQYIEAEPVPLVVHRPQTLSNQHPAADIEVQLSPNPAQDYLMLQGTSSNPIQKVEISRINGSGAKSYDFGNGIYSHRVATGDLPSGTYFARIFCEKGVVVKKFMVVHP